MHQEQMQAQQAQNKRQLNMNSPLQMRQINKFTRDHSNLNSPTLSSRMDKQKYMSPTVASQQRDKVTSIRSHTFKTTQLVMGENQTNNTNDEQNTEKKAQNTKLRTIFRGGIIGIMGGKPRKRKVQDTRSKKKKELEEVKLKDYFQFQKQFIVIIIKNLKQYQEFKIIQELCKFYEYSIINLFNMQKEEEENKLKSLFFALEQLSRVERLKKSMRHFRDSLSLKPVRHDIELNEGWFIPLIYTWQSSPFWQDVLFIIGIIFPMASFVEPPNKHVTDYTDNQILLFYEFILLCFVWIDIIFEYFHRYFDKDKSLFEHYIKNYKLSTRTLIGLCLLVDMIIFHLSFPVLTYRFSRYLRPFLVFYYSHELRRTLISILKSMKQITQLVIFISFLTFFIALIGWRFIGNLDDPTKYDQYSSNFSNLGTASSILYSLISFDSYPECLIPSYNESPFYSLYFVIYCTLLILILIPIPVSVVYDSFRVRYKFKFNFKKLQMRYYSKNKMHRSKLVLIDRIKQREALLSCFISLDFNNQKSVDYKVFHDFMVSMYLHRKSYMKKIKPLYQNLDQNESMSISMNEFFDIIDVMERNPQFQIPIFKDYEIWEKFRGVVNKKIHLKTIVKSSWFDFVMIIVLVVNCVVLFIGMTTDDPDTIEWTDISDDYFFYVYIFEFLVKLIGIGVEKYFDDSWNTFDFSMVIMSFMSLVLSTTLSFLKNAKSAKATKLLRLTKINRIFRIFKALRSIKFLSFLFAGVEVFYQVKQLIQKIVMCLPIVIRLVPIILMLFYIYTYIALENFNTNTFIHNPDSPYDSGFLHFNSFYEGLLIYFQIMLEAGWSSYIYDISYKFDAPYLSNIIFISFDFIVQFIFLSLIKGIVWEVFTVVNEEIKHQEQQNQQRNEQSNNNKLKQENNIRISKKIKNDKENSEQTNPIKDLKTITKSMFQTQNFYSTPKSFGSGAKEATEFKDQDEVSNYFESNFTSEFKGIMLYEKILRNLNNISLNNSIICNEGQLPDVPLYDRQQTCMKDTEESKTDKEIINEHREMSQAMIYQTKQIKSSPQRNNLNLNLINPFNQNNNSPVSPEHKDNQLILQNQQSDNSQVKVQSDNKISFANFGQNDDSNKSVPNSSSDFDKKKFMFFNSQFQETDVKLPPKFSEHIIQKAHLIKSKSLQNQSPSKQSIIGSKYIQNFQSLIDKQSSHVYERSNSKDQSKQDDRNSKDVISDKQDLNTNKQQKQRLSKILNEPITDFQKQIINEENDTSYMSNKHEQTMNKTIGDNASFLQNQDSSFSEVPFKSDNNMKSYIDGPLIMLQEFLYYQLQEEQKRNFKLSFYLIREVKFILKL